MRYSPYSRGVLAAGVGTEQLSEPFDARKASDDLVTLNLVTQRDVQRRPENLQTERTDTVRVVCSTGPLLWSLDFKRVRLGRMKEGKLNK